MAASEVDRQPHILVVDDEPGIRDLLCGLWPRDGHTVEAAADGEQALEMIATCRFDCIIMDLKMPGMSGPELFHEIEGLGEATAARVIFITGDTLSSDTSAFVGSVKNPVLNKPLDVQVLRSEIQKIVGVSD